MPTASTGASTNDHIPPAALERRLGRVAEALYELAYRVDERYAKELRRHAVALSDAALQCDHDYMRTAADDGNTPTVAQGVALGIFLRTAAARRVAARVTVGRGRPARPLPARAPQRGLRGRHRPEGRTST
jgi:hypothetical protein